MRKFSIWLGIILICVCGFAAYSLYRLWEENYTAQGVTITVKTPDNILIPSTIIRLESVAERFVIQKQTNLWGKIYFQRLPAGLYAIKATQIYCAGGKDEAHVISLNISGQNTKIEYFPCG